MKAEALQKRCTETSLKRGAVVRVFWAVDNGEDRTIELRVTSDSAETLVGINVRTRLKHIIDKRAIGRVEEVTR